MKPTPEQPPSAAIADGGFVPDDRRIALALDEYLSEIEAGRAPDRQALLAAHPDIADNLAKCLDGLAFIEKASPHLQTSAYPTAPLPESAGEGTLGDYRLIREIGRGGMGIVYEAEQLSLCRRVALKVLPFASTLDLKQLQRFKNEAHAAAQLHHSNIVPVFATGCERSVHFYAMQYIEGQTLAELIRATRDEGQNSVVAAAANADTREPQAITVSTERSSRSPAYFRTVAHIGIQVAEALEHAHQVGIIHRDIKPGNLLIENAPLPPHSVPLRVWITDFGLAHCQNQVGPTMTGDLVGTLRYMSPEQALGRRVVLDQRTDVYSLGATLYELLTLQPAFDGQDRQELMRQIACEEPRQPRRVNKNIPPELDTIVLKALEKNLADRFCTAQELADDLRRFLNDEPIRAQPPSVWQRCRKWSRRHKAVIRSAVVTLLVSLAAVAGSIGWSVRDQAAREEKIERDRLVRETALDQTVENTLNQTGPLIEQGKWSAALALVDRAEQLLAAAGRTERPKRLIDLRKDLGMAERLEEIYRQPNQSFQVTVVAVSVDGSTQRLPQPRVNSEEDFFWGKEQDRRFGQAFLEFGIDMKALGTAEAAALVRDTSTRQALVQALDEWAAMRKRARGDEDDFWKKLVEIARQADPDEWRNRCREALLGRDRPALEKLADTLPIRAVPPTTAFLLGHALRELGNLGKAIAVVQEAHRQYPDDFWLNDALGYFSKDFCRPPRYDDALCYYSMAVALRPQNAMAWYYRGNTYYDLHQYEKAIADYSKAIELDTKDVRVWNQRGNAYYGLGQYEKAIADYSNAIELDPKNALVWYNRGCAYNEIHQHDKALADLTKAVELDQKDVDAWIDRGRAYNGLHQYEKAIADFSKAIELDPKNTGAWFGRGTAYHELHQYDKAIVEHSKAIEFDANNAVAWYWRGLAYQGLHQYDKAIVDYSKAIDLGLKNAWLWYWRGNAYNELHQYEKAIADFSKAIELDPKLALAWNNRGIAYYRLPQSDKAVSDFAKALGLEPKNPLFQNNLAWLLATCPEAKLRDPKRAVELAAAAVKTQPKEAVPVKAQPKEAAYWTTLGVARYRAGDWKGTTEDLQNALKLFQGACGFQRGVGRSLFFLAMAHHQLGHRQEARQTYDRALAWLETNRKALREIPWLANELRRFQIEAAELLKQRIDESQPTKVSRFAPQGWEWYDRLGAQLLRREAERLVMAVDPDQN
jgi:tetratricopeptide (TPR) repeat protein